MKGKEKISRLLKSLVPPPLGAIPHTEPKLAILGTVHEKIPLAALLNTLLCYILV